eukprot:snap_masked-scaffold954_size76946-processed-gene-0.15 protein:Tk12150 transcript:snap_masked-scaffold954_size76946-processed-gene-0.15-mRNA-1 annotation:"transmembrane and tpr repeat-containing protein cg4050-like"
MANSSWMSLLSMASDSLVKRSSHYASRRLSHCAPFNTHPPASKMSALNSLDSEVEHPGDSNNNLNEEQPGQGGVAWRKKNSRSGSGSPGSAQPEVSWPSLEHWISHHRPLVHTLLILLCLSVYWNSLDGEFVFDDIHTEAVSGVVGRAELLSSLCYLMAFLAYMQASSAPMNWRHYPNESHKKSSPKPPSHAKRSISMFSGFPSASSAGCSVNWLALIRSMALVALGMLCKEQGITVLGVCVVYELCYVQEVVTRAPSSRLSANFRHWVANMTRWSAQTKAACQRMGVLTLCAVGLMLVRLRIMVHLPQFYTYDNPAAAASTPSRQMTYGYLFSVNTWLLLNPSDLCCDWTMGTLPLVHHVLDERNLATLGLLVVLAWLVHHMLTRGRRQKELPVILALIAFPFLPASNVFFPVGFVVAERVLYLPSMGFSLLVAVGWDRCQKYLAEWSPRRGKILSHLWNLSLILCLVAHTAKVLVRNPDWQNEYSLFTSGLKVTQANAKLFSNVGHALEREDRFEEALQYFRQAVRVQPDDIGALINVGRTLNHMKHFDEAEVAYTQAMELLPQSRSGETFYTRVAPNHLSVFLNLASLIARNGSRLEEADQLYRQAIAMRADYTQAYINRGDVLIKLNRTDEAQAVYEKALSFDSDHPDLLYNMGVVMLNQNHVSQALAYFDLALKVDPEHRQALLNSAILIQETEGWAHLRATAIERLMKIVSTPPNQAPGKPGQEALERVFFNLAMLHMDEGDLTAAEGFFERAIALQSDFRSALFNYALLLSETGRAGQSGPLLHQLIHYHPDHVKGLILLGDLYVNHVGDLEKAEQCYRTILQLEPDHIQGRHNLCVVLLERDPNRVENLAQTKACLEEVSRSAPEEDYILKHLRIVEAKLEALTHHHQ